MKPGETLAAQNIVPQTNPWFFGGDQPAEAEGGARQRLLDNAPRSCTRCRTSSTARSSKAIRDAGYQGPLCGSPWQAPSMVPHYYNLRSDYLVGFIDRHNYFGGKLFDTMLTQARQRLFLAAACSRWPDRPFGLSRVDSRLSVAVQRRRPGDHRRLRHGLAGLGCVLRVPVGVSRGGMFSDRVGWHPWGVWEADVPTQLGQYPALARMIYRGDVQQGEVISVAPREPAGAGERASSVSPTRSSSKATSRSFGGTRAGGGVGGRAGRGRVHRHAGAVDVPGHGAVPQGKVITSHDGPTAWDTAGQGYLPWTRPAPRPWWDLPRAKSNGWAT